MGKTILRKAEVLVIQVPGFQNLYIRPDGCVFKSIPVARENLTVVPLPVKYLMKPGMYETLEYQPYVEHEHKLLKVEDLMKLTFPCKFGLKKEGDQDVEGQ